MVLVNVTHGRLQVYIMLFKMQQPNGKAALAHAISPRPRRADVQHQALVASPSVGLKPPEGHRCWKDDDKVKDKELPNRERSPDRQRASF